MNEKCEHKTKVYANYVLCSNPPQQPWICADCGHKGCDQSELGNTPSYEDIVKKFEKKTLWDKRNSFKYHGEHVTCYVENDVKESLKEFLASLPEDGEQYRKYKAKEIFGEELIQDGN